MVKMKLRNHRSGSKDIRQGTKPSELPTAGMPLSAQMHLILPILGIIAYLTLFFAWPLLSISQVFQRPFRRYELFQLLLTPEELLKSWLGSHGEFSIFDRLPIFCAAAIILAAGIAWGVAISRVMGVKLSLLEIVSIALPVGLNVISTLVLLGGLFGLLRQRWLLAAIVFLPPTLYIIPWQSLLRLVLKPDVIVQRLRPIFPVQRATTVQSLPEKILSWVCIGATLTAIVIILLAASLPPVDFDVREYHLQCPKEFFQQGRITFLPHNVYGNMPLGLEMHALLGMLLLNDFWYGALAGKVVMATFALIGAAALLHWARSRGASSPWVAPAIFISVPWVISVSTAGLNDIGLAVYIFTAFCAASKLVSILTDADQLYPALERGADWATITRENQQPERNPLNKGCPIRRESWAWVIIAGYLAGAAAACKYTGLLFGGFLIGMFLLVTLAHRIPVRSLLLMLGLYGLGIILGAGGWYIKNLVFSGNPVYPLAYEWLGGTSWNPEKAARWARIHSPHDFSVRMLLVDLGRVFFTSEWQSPLITPLAFLGLLRVSKQRLFEKATAVMAIVLFLLWWCLTHRIDRFWLPMLPFLCVLATVGFDWTDRLWWRWFVTGICLIAMICNGLVITSGAAADNRYFAPLAQLRNDPGRIGADHALLNELFARDHAEGKKKKLLAVGEAAVFDLEMPVLYATCFDDQPWEILTKGKTPKEVRETLHRENVGYLYVNWLEIARYRSPGNYGFTEFVQPEQFRELTRAGVLVPVLMPTRSPNQIYLVP